jgi:hypothetical protein
MLTRIATQPDATPGGTHGVGVTVGLGVDVGVGVGICVG